MLPHSYTADSLSQSQDLTSIILSSSTPQEISSACASIESFLHSHSPDQCRHFFSVTFPPLICKLFGFNDATSSPAKPKSQLANGWIDTVLLSDDADLAARVFSLLSPEGTLMSTISALDSLFLVKYVFPTERLPEWTRFMLSTDKDCSILSVICSLFKGKVGEDSINGSFRQIHLNVFEYYMFWFAYYPVCRGNRENLVSVSVKRSKKFRLENWTYSIRGSSSVNKREPERKLECNLYIRLLLAYLRSFVPVLDFRVHQSYGSLLHYASGHDGSIISRAEFLVNTFVHYWLVDNDFSPLPVNVCKSFGVSFPSRLVLGETIPTSGLGEAVKLFVEYLNLSLMQS
ncbi:uncharacterized protein LOC110822182 [Carica papaya]|uniref:uncharacterized protein LOC110822182 n=1 Tax=Carica papaya TaxID=3649 RepID=UPI000B8C9A3A|nr:uncharacterized protein LOC110822182 [Carica papaya]